MGTQNPLDYNDFLKEINTSLLKEPNENNSTELLDKSEYNTYESDNARLKIIELQAIIDMRKEWSKLFKMVVVAVLLFEIILTIFVGYGWFVFEDSWFLRIIIVSGFAQILTMPYTITRFLFGKGSLNNKN